jgi:hypothetical protein
VPAFAATSSAAPVHRSSASATAKTVASRQNDVTQLAPADEYFGPLKLSILGIRNTIRDLGARYDVNHDIGHQTFTSAQLTEKAIHEWEHRYPRDGQVPKAIYLLQRLYTKVLTQESRDRAAATAKWMFADYGSSPQGRQLKKTLAVEHLQPLTAPSAAPLPAAAPAGEAPPAAAPAAAPGAVTPATTSLVPAPAPAPSAPN